MLEGLNDIDWKAVVQPEDNEPDALRQAILHVAHASTGEQADFAANDILYAVGNNHRGTYYPAVLTVLPFLREILEVGQTWARITVLNVLTDLAGSYQPDERHATIQMASGEVVKLADALHAAVSEMRPLIHRLAESSELSNNERRLATELESELDAYM